MPGVRLGGGFNIEIRTGTLSTPLLKLLRELLVLTPVSAVVKLPTNFTFP